MKDFIDFLSLHNKMQGKMMIILGKTKDLRTDTNILYVQTSITEYLALLGDNFDEYGIQRKREKFKAYERMKNDIENGALLPTITLSLKTSYVDECNRLINESFEENKERIVSYLSNSNMFNILDGLQRTYTLLDLKGKQFQFEDEQKLHLEIWLEKEKKHLIYRLIVLNAGQKRMTLRHQLELLFQNLIDSLKEQIPGIQIYKEVDETRRSHPNQFSFERIVTSYQCYLNKTPEIQKDNIIANQLIEDSILDSDENELDKNLNDYLSYLSKYTEIDTLCFNTYNAKSRYSYANWLSQENTINCFFASISDFSINASRSERVLKAISNLIQYLKSNLDEDPLGIEILNKVIEGFDVRKANVGVKTRKLLLNGFKEFFREEGEKLLKDCWVSESD